MKFLYYLKVLREEKALKSVHFDDEFTAMIILLQQDSLKLGA